MKLKRFNEMFVDENGNIWDDEDMTQRSFHFEDEVSEKDIVVHIMDSDLQDLGDFRFLIYFIGPDGCQIDQEALDVIDEDTIADFEENGISESGECSFDVQGEWTIESLKKYLRGFGFKDVIYDGD